MFDCFFCLFFQSLVHFMLEEVVNSTVNRCISTELMEPSVSTGRAGCHFKMRGSISCQNHKTCIISWQTTPEKYSVVTGSASCSHFAIRIRRLPTVIYKDCLYFHGLISGISVTKLWCLPRRFF